MPEEPSDLDRLIGSDKRQIPIPKGLGLVVAIIAFGTLVGLVLLYPTEDPDIDLTDFGFASDVVPAQVSAVENAECPGLPEIDCEVVSFSEPGSDVVIHTQAFPEDPGQPRFEVGDRVFLSEVADAGYQYADKDRTRLLAVIAIVFAVSVVLLGGLRGWAALAGLAISLLILLGFIVPAIIAGEDAVLVALVGGGAIVLVALYLAHGYNPLTHVAAIGAFGALALTTGLSWLVVTLADFTGLANEESFYLLLIPGFDISGLLLAGIVLGAIGALDDVTVTQASAVWEVRSANPDLDHGHLYQAGMRVGRDHIASTVNTLLLAYAGAAMPLLILFTLSNQSLVATASSEIVAVEIVRTLVGSIGLVAAVPITTWLAARYAAEHDTSNKVDDEPLDPEGFDGAVRSQPDRSP